LRPLAARSGSALECLARDLRAMPIPVIGRIEGGRVILDLRCLENETAFIAQLACFCRHPRGSGGPGPATGALQPLDSRFRGNDDEWPDPGSAEPDP
jgi:hypothetical protein